MHSSLRSLGTRRALETAMSRVSGSRVSTAERSSRMEAHWALATARVSLAWLWASVLTPFSLARSSSWLRSAAEASSMPVWLTMWAAAISLQSSRDLWAFICRWTVWSFSHAASTPNRVVISMTCLSSMGNWDDMPTRSMASRESLTVFTKCLRWAKASRWATRANSAISSDLSKSAKSSGSIMVGALDSSSKRLFISWRHRSARGDDTFPWAVAAPGVPAPPPAPSPGPAPVGSWALDSVRRNCRMYGSKSGEGRKCRRHRARRVHPRNKLWSFTLPERWRQSWTRISSARSPVSSLQPRFTRSTARTEGYIMRMSPQYPRMSRLQTLAAATSALVGSTVRELWRGQLSESRWRRSPRSSSPAAPRGAARPPPSALEKDRMRRSSTVR
mmetsp:Transcript_10893/g.31236  ORF Transcript_10893/g.31236 Transcript_10893/m.31236 type:complete len:389 (-) Transcript_10893:596-1762(-)